MFCTDLRSTSRLMMNGLKSSSAISFGESGERRLNLDKLLEEIVQRIPNFSTPISHFSCYATFDFQ